MGRFKSIVDVFSGLALIMASIVVVRSSLGREAPAGTPPDLDGKVVSLRGSASLGDESAPIGVIVFSDFECPFCGKFAQESLPALVDGYVKRGKVRFAFRHFPLAIHRNAQLAARASECARAEGRFWELHDVFFANQSSINAAELPRLGKEAGLSDAWPICAADAISTSADAVARDLGEANALGIVSTPTVLLGKLAGGAIRVQAVIGGARPAAEFTAAIDKLLR